MTNLLDGLLGSKLRAKVLGWLFTHADERYYVRQLTKILEDDPTNISRELARLERMGLLTLVVSGRQKYYQANTLSPIFDEIHRLMVKTYGVADVLRTALEPLSKEIITAFIFGSFAKGTEKRSSDIDLMAVGEVSFDEMVSALTPAEKTLRREINSVIYTRDEITQKMKNDSNFLKTVLESDKIFLIGDNDELTRIAGGRAPAAI